MKSGGNSILITGGGSGIGRALATSFAALGNTVVVAGRNEENLEETAKMAEGIHPIQCDLGDDSSLDSFVAHAIELAPSLNVLINNAGIMRFEDLKRGETEDALETVNTNLLAPIRLTAALLPHLLKQPSATIINVTSGLAFVPMPATPTYCATKAALHSYTISLREQLRDTSIEVIELAPPYVQTGLSGAGHASDPRALPLDDYIKESMNILFQEDHGGEVLVERVKPIRFAESQGTFQDVLTLLCDMGKDRSAP